MATRGKKAGTLWVKVNGRQISAQGSMTCPFYTKPRTTQLDTNGKAVNYTEEPIAPYISGTFYTTGLTDDDIREISESDTLTVTAAFKDGASYTVSDGWLAGESEINLDEATVPLRFEGMEGTW